MHEFSVIPSSNIRQPDKKKVNFSALQIIHFFMKKAEELFYTGPLIAWQVISKNHMSGLDLEQPPPGT